LVFFDLIDINDGIIESSLGELAGIVLDLIVVNGVVEG